MVMVVVGENGKGRPFLCGNEMFRSPYAIATMERDGYFGCGWPLFVLLLGLRALVVFKVFTHGYCAHSFSCPYIKNWMTFAWRPN